MFIRKDVGEKIVYISTSNEVIKQITFNPEYSLNILTFNGKFSNWDELKKFNQGILGDITIFPNQIKICTNKISTDQLKILFETIDSACIKERDSSFRGIKDELFNIITSKINKSNLNKSSPDNKINSEKRNLLNPEVRNPEEKNDLQSMYIDKIQILGDLAFENIKANTIFGKTCRTVKSSYQYQSSFYSYKTEIEVCRTTIIAPGFKTAYIEYRRTPEANYGEDYASKPEEHQWLIAFNTAEDAKQYQALIPEFYRYSPRLFSPVKAYSSNLFCIDRQSIDETLSKLVGNGCCPQEAIDQQLGLPGSTHKKIIL